MIETLRSIALWHTDTITMPELLWTSVATAALGVSITLIRHMGDSRDVLYEKRRLFSVLDFRVMNRLATSHLQNEVLRATAHSVSIVAGLLLMMVPPANPDQPVTAGSWLIALALIAKASLHMAASLKDWFNRKQLLDELREEEEFYASLGRRSIS